MLEEVDGTDTGLEQHIKTSLRPAIMQEQYMGHPVAVVGDPAGRNRSSLFEMNEYDLFRTMGFTAFPAPTNDLDPRLRAVESFPAHATRRGAGYLDRRGQVPEADRGAGRAVPLCEHPRRRVKADSRQK